ncbi:hypothetical protein [Mycolicibacterium mengxianglii]|uniref:hypothetical protein n=1 Tax=Mycolicibacterium mengxianglii TaxID=2736649 RepID=UPI0018D05BA6|nr:hypothetical protein [Mycolicibacterium mengxianglii]
MTAAVAMAAFAAGSAAPASAEPAPASVPFNGTYTGGDAENVWTVATQCQTEGCTGTVSSNQGWAVPAKLVQGMWQFIITKPDGVICDDGDYAPAYIELEVSPVTLNGTITTDDNYSCPGGNVTTAPFTLTKIS